MCDGLIEIYMPDAKYSDAKIAAAFSGAEDYPEVNRAALKEMHRQVGNLEVAAGVARRGLLVRHLVLPNHPENTRGVLDFIAGEISPESYVNIMDQYRPCHQAGPLPGMNRKVCFPLSNTFSLWTIIRPRISVTIMRTLSFSGI